jgi:hypothetical protein
VNEWLDRARKSLAAEVGDPPASISLSEADITEILDLARVAAHDSGERPTAPVVSYLVGLVRGRHPEADLTELVRAIVGPSPEA